MDSKTLLFSVTIKDCRVDTFRCPGKGGQNVNKVSSGVRITHPPSGATASSCLTRDQFRNKRDAWKKLAKDPKFRAWVNLKAAELNTGKTVEERVEEAMDERNIKTEVRTENGWEVSD